MADNVSIISWVTGGISALFCICGNVSRVPWPDSESPRSLGADVEYPKVPFSKHSHGGSWGNKEVSGGPWADVNFPRTPWADKGGFRDNKTGCETLKSNWTDGEDSILTVVDAEISKPPGEALDIPGLPGGKGVHVQHSRLPCKELPVNRGNLSQFFATKVEGLDLLVLERNGHKALGHVAMFL